jgi:murein DD-endopeptidase MepM/ murein hydrolase activator NlpD
VSVEIIESPLLSHQYRMDENQHFQYAKLTRTPEVRQVTRHATITDSLFLAAQRSDIPAGLTMEAAGIFGGVIDFILDVREGDTFRILYEEKYLDGELIENGRILAAQFTNQGTTHTALRYTNALGESNFYNPEGESMRKAFLLNPVDFTRISSGFSLSRKHPILNTIRAHKGTDYAAPRGTPVVATADGRVTYAGRNGSFGNLVVIQHGDRFETKYAHLNGYGRDIKVGARVRQEQVIGYVGSTGSATGPHLHYEFLMDGVHRNSRTIHQSLPKAESVSAGELASFHEQTSPLLAQIDQSTNRQLAFVGPPADLE